MEHGDFPIKQDLAGQQGTNSCTHFSALEGQHFGADDKTYRSAGGAGDSSVEETSWAAEGELE